MSKIKIKFNGIELEKIESDKVLCIGANGMWNCPMPSSVTGALCLATFAIGA